jgi:hypothetical protein
MSSTPILRTHEERRAAIDRFGAEGKSPNWIHGWWRYQMRHPDSEPRLEATNPVGAGEDRDTQ